MEKNLDQIAPELRSSIKRFRSLKLDNIFILYLAKLLVKIVPIPEAGPDIVIKNHQINHNVAVRIYRPNTSYARAAVLWMHGGGLITGRYEDDRICGDLARELKLVVVSVKYRLAPRYKYPCAIDDCAIAWSWLQSKAVSLGVDFDRIAIAGQSAGGGLAASLAQRIYDAGGAQPVAQVLFSPMLDDRTALRADFDALNHRVWPNRVNRKAWSWYLGQAAGALSIPPYAAAARRQNLTGLPPAWIATSDGELFYDEDCDYAARLSAAGVQCHLHTVSKAPHGFDIFVPESSLARDMFKSAYEFLNKKLNLTLPSSVEASLSATININ